MNVERKLEAYISEHIDPEDLVLKELDRETNLTVPGARMLSGHLQGKVLSMLSQIMEPERILEIGTFTGYSAICLARGLKDNGKLITIEADDELQPIANKYFRKAGLQNKIDLIIGHALEVLPTIEGPLDIIFMDADKREYPAYYDLVIDKLRKGGLLIADNTLWNGKVIEPAVKGDEQTQGIKKFNEMVRSDSRVQKVILPLRDGMTIIRKI